MKKIVKSVFLGQYRTEIVRILRRQIFRQIVQIERRRAGLSVSPSGTAWHLTQQGETRPSSEILCTHYALRAKRYVRKYANKGIAVNCAVLFQVLICYPVF